MKLKKNKGKGNAYIFEKMQAKGRNLIVNL